MPNKINQILRELPSVNKIIEGLSSQELNLPYSIILETVRDCVADFRKKILEGKDLSLNNLDVFVV